MTKQLLTSTSASAPTNSKRELPYPFLSTEGTIASRRGFRCPCDAAFECARMPQDIDTDMLTRRRDIAYR